KNLQKLSTEEIVKRFGAETYTVAQTNIQHICNIGHWYSEKTKERRTTGRKPQGICYWGYLILGVIGKPFL
ncbi:hypothetical protein AAH001_07100, partial [Phocaeicola vulgatus]|uniref:hypothetical protein n=1 Tax=Phocaeicola vulgatus TaxID=821 RepID=UPI0039B66117